MKRQIPIFLILQQQQGKSHEIAHVLSMTRWHPKPVPQIRYRVWLQHHTREIKRQNLIFINWVRDNPRAFRIVCVTHVQVEVLESIVLRDNCPLH
jgi:hypothetical protein